MLIIVNDAGPVVSDINISDVARVLRAAPQMRILAAPPRLRDDASSLTTSAAPLHPAFVGVAHSRLRQFYVNASSDDMSSRDELCASRLRQACFPRLQSMLVAGQQYFPS
jgi:hypothetical protein